MVVGRITQILRAEKKSWYNTRYRPGSSSAERVLGKNEVAGPIPAPGSMRKEDIRYIHAIAKLAFQASARGEMPVEDGGQFLDFFSRLTHDRVLSTDEAWQTFERCFEMERTRRHERKTRVRPS